MFGTKKYRKEIDSLKGMIAQYEFKVTQRNEAFEALYDFIHEGMPLGKDSKIKDYVKEGYEGNPDLFSIISKLAGMFAGIPLIPMILKGDRYEPVDDPEINRFFGQTNYYQTWNEFRKHWIISAYVSGNMITYAPKLSTGLNSGKINNDGLIVLPTQNINIESKGWRQPIGKYTLDINQSYKIDPVDIWHERFAPTLTYDQGKNFMGQSPIKVARDIINAQNAGYEVVAKTYKKGHPSTIIYKETPENDIGGTSDEQSKKFRKRWISDHQGPDNMQIPVFTVGKVGAQKIGFDNFKELEIIPMNEHGRRVFCNIMSVPSVLFNDKEAATYKNMGEAQKAIYTNRIIPDINTFCDGFNTILKPYGEIILKPDFSGIEALQEDKGEKSKWVSLMWNDGVITGDGYLEMMGEEPTGLPEMQRRYIAANRLPMDFQDDDSGKSDKFYIRNNILNAM